MTILDDVKLALKLPLILGALALMTLLGMGAISLRIARESLLEAAQTQMRTTIAAERAEVVSWFAVVEADLRALAQSPQTERALREYRAAWTRMDGDAGALLRQHFITDNPYPAGERHKLRYVSGISDYSIAHGRYHGTYAALAAQKGYHDVLLVGVEGDILYSVAKEEDLGQNLITGPLRSTPLSQLVRRVMHQPGADVLFSDIAFYGPSADAPAGFAAAPVRDRNGAVLGALVFQIGPELIPAGHQGAGADGRLTYLVGRDLKLRSDLGGDGTPAILVQRSAGSAIRAAFGGQEAMAREDGIFGVPSMVSARRIALPGLELALVQEVPLAAILAPVRELTRRLAMAGLPSMLLLGAIVHFLARGLSRPLVAQSQVMRRIAEGDYGAAVPFTRRRDEIGTIARAVETFRDGLRETAEIAREGAFKSAAFRGSSAALMLFDASFRIVDANPAVRELLARHLETLRELSPELDPEALVGDGRAVLSLLPPELAEIAARPGGLPHAFEIRPGQLLFALELNEVTMAEGERIGFALEWRDVTEAGMNRAVLAALDSHLAVAEFDSGGGLIRANARMQALIGSASPGTGAGDLSRIRFWDGSEAAEAASGSTDLRARILSGESLFGHFFVVGAEGFGGIVEGGISPIRDRDGRLMKVLLMGSDVTQAQLALRKAEDRRRAMEAAKSRVVELLRVALRRLSQGDLTTRIDEPVAEDYETLRGDFNRAIERLAEAMAEVIASAAGIEAEASEISRANADLTRRTDAQVTTLEQTAAALDQLTLSVRAAASGAAEASREVSGARSSAVASGEIVRETVEAMGAIESSSERIARIIGVIDDIAFQTNLLALNAGVEAARAGEAGRGFAVVAAEVRALAQRSSEAAREIDDLISASAEQVKRGVALVGQTGQALGEIVHSVSVIADRVAEIAQSAQEQSAGLVEINSAVGRIDQVTQENAALFGETAAASLSLRRGAQSLNATVSRFTIAPADRVVAAHGSDGPPVSGGGSAAGGAERAGMPGRQTRERVVAGRAEAADAAPEPTRPAREPAAGDDGRPRRQAAPQSGSGQETDGRAGQGSDGASLRTARAEHAGAVRSPARSAGAPDPASPGEAAATEAPPRRSLGA
ncbi:methyl-accepting chemotaxis protein [Albidovulum sp.]